MMVEEEGIMDMMRGVAGETTLRYLRGLAMAI